MSDICMYLQTELFSLDRNKLVWNATPTIVNVPNPPAQLTLKRKAPSARQHLPLKKTRLVKEETSIDSSSCNGKDLFHLDFPDIDTLLQYSTVHFLWIIYSAIVMGHLIRDLK